MATNTAFGPTHVLMYKMYNINRKLSERRKVVSKVQNSATNYSTNMSD